MRSEDVRRWVADRRATARRENADAAGGSGPDDAVAAALALVALHGRLHGWPAAEDVVTAREDREMWDRFARLRRKHESRG